MPRVNSATAREMADRSVAARKAAEAKRAAGPASISLQATPPMGTDAGTGTVEFYATPPPLDQIVVGGLRSPIQTSTLTLPQGLIMPGGAASINVPAGPASAQFALFVINLEDSSAQLGATDFFLVPLDAALAPILTSGGSWANVGSSVMLVGGDTSINLGSRADDGNDFHGGHIGDRRRKIGWRQPLIGGIGWSGLGHGPVCRSEQIHRAGELPGRTARRPPGRFMTGRRG